MVAAIAPLCAWKRKLFGSGKQKSVRRIAVVKITGMGSMVQATPLLQTLRRNFTDAELIFITSRANAELVELLPMIDHKWTVDDRTVFSFMSTWIRLMAKLWRHHIDVYFDLEVYSWFSTFLTFLSGAGKKLGLHRPTSIDRSGIYHHFIQYNNRVPVSEVYMQMGRTLQWKQEIAELYQFKIANHRGVPEKKEISALTNREYIVINPNASDLRSERRWGVKNFAELINHLAVRLPSMQFVLTGLANESANVASILDQVSPSARSRVINTCGKLALSELIGIIAKANLMVTNDSGPMHLAFAMNVPVVALFGPCSPLQYKMNERTYIIYKNLYCSPCVHLFIKSPCNGDNQCMKLIPLEEVVNTCMKAFQGEPPAPFATSEIKFSAHGIIPLGTIRN